MTSLTQKINVYHHLIPPGFARALARSGFQELVGAPLPAWSPKSSVETMDMDGIATAILSLSNPGVYFGNLPKHASLRGNVMNMRLKRGPSIQIDLDRLPFCRCRLPSRRAVKQNMLSIR